MSNVEIILTEKELDEYWSKFRANPKGLDIHEYNAIMDTAQHFYSKGVFSKSKAESMINPVMEIIMEVMTERMIASGKLVWYLKGR
jgi:hypothetical protein